jgi:hypothetical protein
MNHHKFQSLARWSLAALCARTKKELRERRINKHKRGETHRKRIKGLNGLLNMENELAGSAFLAFYSGLLFR